MRSMYDGIDSDAAVIPRTAQLVAGYIDGGYIWTQADWDLFPGSVKVRIAVHSGTNDGHVLDVENGDATPAESVDWVLMRRKAGADPSVYCNQLDQNTGLPAVRAAFQDRGVPEPHYWVADYDGDPAIPSGCVAKQHTSTADWDLSSVADYWPGVDPAPVSSDTNASEDDMAMKQSQQSSDGVALIAFAADTDTTVEFGTDPQFLKAKPTFRASLMMAGKTPDVLAENVALDGTGTYVLHIPAALVPYARILCVTCSSTAVPFAVYVQ